jgi:hypothetical protein
VLALYRAGASNGANSVSRFATGGCSNTSHNSAAE